MSKDKEVCWECGKELGPNSETNFCRGTDCAAKYAKKNKKKKPPTGKPGPRKSSIFDIAMRVAASSHESIERPGVESSARVDIAFSADFEGPVSKQELTKKINDEIIAALEVAVKIVSRDLQLKPGQVRVKPLRVEVAMNDQGSLDEDEENQAQGE
jgi:hypothetical protein